MKYKKIILLVMVLVLGSYGLTGVSAMATPLSNLAPKQWMGQTFLFHALPGDRQEEGYEIFKTEDADRGWGGERLVRIPYAAHVYERVKVTDVVEFPAGINQTDYLIYMKEISSGMKLVGRTTHGQLEGLLLEADLNQAREQFLGKKVYSKMRFLQTENQDAGEAAPKVIPVKIGSEAQVVDIYTGIRTDEPIWLIVLIDGQRARVPIAYSWSNIRGSAWKQTPPWQEKLFTKDPRSHLGWSREVWEQIDASSVVEGMTKMQVELSWGGPVSIMENPDGSGKSVWTYGSSTLTFNGDALAAIENVH